MKRLRPAGMFIAAFLVCAANSSAQQTAPLTAHFRSIPLHQSANANPPSMSPMAATAAAVTSSSTVPMWSYAVTKAPRRRKNYTGVMVGRSPFFHGARTTNVNTILIPVKVTFQDTGTVFDPTQTDPVCLRSSLTPLELVQQSPLLMPATFSMNGVVEEDTQYVDAFQRANFFDAVNLTGNSYHTLLNLTATLSGISASIPSGSGQTQSAASLAICGPIGIVDINAVQKIVENTLIPQLAAQGVGATKLPIFLFYNVVMSDGPPNKTLSNCCDIGFHSAVGSASNAQLYVVSDYDSTDAFVGSPSSGHGLNTATLSHEIAETTDDPLDNNATPSWGDTGQVSGCQSNLEVGDPLTGSYVPEVTMPNGISYDLQELAFYSWFFGGPSIGAGGLFSDQGTFTTDAGKICKG